MPCDVLELENQSCCLCGRDGVEIGTGKDFEYGTTAAVFTALRCTDCQLVYLKQRPAIGELDRIYPPHYHAYEFSPEQFGIVHKVRRVLEARRLLRCSGDLPPNARLLDVGCGDGFHLRLLRDFGQSSWKLEGIDASSRAVDAARRADLPVRCGFVERADLEQDSYDLVLLIATIEHVADPVGTMCSIARLLRPGGKVAVVTDNTATLDFRINRRSVWGGYHFPRHWNLFNPNSLRVLAARSNLEVVSIGSIVSPVNWVYSIRNRLVDRQAHPRLIECFSLKAPVGLALFTVLDAIFKLFGHGSLLRMIARRRSN